MIVPPLFGGTPGNGHTPETITLVLRTFVGHPEKVAVSPLTQLSILLQPIGFPPGTKLVVFQ
jgi:hypothetical protein